MKEPGASDAGLFVFPLTISRNQTMTHIHKPPARFNETPLGSWAERERLRSLPVGIRVLVRRRHLPIWRALAVSEIAGFGGLHDR